MATYTPNYNLKKPALNDKIRIADFNGNADIIDGAMNDNATLIAQLKSDIGIVENTNTATHNISAGQYVIWKGSLYTASSAISSGATLSDANLTAVSGGGLNALNDKIGNNSIPTSDISSSHTIDTSSSAMVKTGNVLYLRLSITLTSNVSAYGTIATLPTSARPISQYVGFCFDSTSTPVQFDITYNGAIRLWQAKNSGQVINIAITYALQ